MNKAESPQTKIDAYQALLDSGEDLSLRREVAIRLMDSPATTHELTQDFPERSANAIRPRVNELLRMGCVRRTDTRMNPSGNDAFVHELTRKGELYAQGDIDPSLPPTLASRKQAVVEAAREHIQESDIEGLVAAVVEHDELAKRMDPEGEYL